MHTRARIRTDILRFAAAWVVWLLSLDGFRYPRMAGSYQTETQLSRHAMSIEPWQVPNWVRLRRWIIDPERIRLVVAGWSIGW